MWTVDVTADSDSDKDVLEPYSASGSFTATKVGRFHVEVVEPKDGQIYPLNRIVNGTPEDIALPVQVAIIDDESGMELTDGNLAAGADASRMISVTVDANGTTSGLVALKYDSSSRSWKGILESGLGQTPDEIGIQTLQANIDHNAFDRSRYRPSITVADQNQVSFERVMIHAVELESSVTEVITPLYGGTQYCLNAESIPLQTDIAVISRTGGQRTVLDPSFLSSDGAPLGIAELIDPRTNMVLETGKMEIVQNAADKVLRVTIGSEHVEAGQYEIRITPLPEA